jgi:hypothetical protein
LKSRTQLFACVIRQYGTGLYRSCVHLDEGGAHCLGAYQDEASAYETVARFLEGIRTLPHADALGGDQEYLDRVRELIAGGVGRQPPHASELPNAVSPLNHAGSLSPP